MSRTFCHQKSQRMRRLLREIRQRCSAGNVFWSWNVALLPESIRLLEQEWFDLANRGGTWQAEAMRRNSVRHATSRLIWLKRKRKRGQRRREAERLIDEQLHADQDMNWKGVCRENTG